MRRRIIPPVVFIIIVAGLKLFEICLCCGTRFFQCLLTTKTTAACGSSHAHAILSDRLELHEAMMMQDRHRIGEDTLKQLTLL